MIFTTPAGSNVVVTLDWTEVQPYNFGRADGSLFYIPPTAEAVVYSGN